MNASSSCTYLYNAGRLHTLLQASAAKSLMAAAGLVMAERQRSAGNMTNTPMACDRAGTMLGMLALAGGLPCRYSPYGFDARDDRYQGLLGFCGELRQTSTLYLLGNGYRAYSPSLMRFNSPDASSPFKDGGLSTYAYCLGDPINYTDPTGNSAYSALRRFFRSNKANFEKYNKKLTTRREQVTKSKTAVSELQDELSQRENYDWNMTLEEQIHNHEQTIKYLDKKIIKLTNLVKKYARKTGLEINELTPKQLDAQQWYSQRNTYLNSIAKGIRNP